MNAGESVEVACLVSLLAKLAYSQACLLARLFEHDHGRLPDVGEFAVMVETAAAFAVTGTARECRSILGAAGVDADSLSGSVEGVLAKVKADIQTETDFRRRYHELEFEVDEDYGHGN